MISLRVAPFQMVETLAFDSEFTLDGLDELAMAHAVNRFGFLDLK